MRHRFGLGVIALVCVGLFSTLAAGTVWADQEPLWNAAWITDTQTTASEWITTLVARVQANRPRMVIHTGDTRFEWANRCAWRAVMALLRTKTPPLEFHLVPGNHDLTNGVLKLHLREAATRGTYRLDTGEKASGFGYYHNRVPRYESGPLWPAWNPDVVDHPAWQISANEKPQDSRHPEIPYRYVFSRGGIRFIVCDCYYTEEQREWIRDLIVQPDDSSVSIVLHHPHGVDDLAEYFEGLDGRHNVKLVLSGDHHNYKYAERHGVTFTTAAGLAKGPEGENDAMTLWVYEDRLRLDRYVIPKGSPMKSVEGPVTIWTCEGAFSPYNRPEGSNRKQATDGVVREEASHSETGRATGPVPSRTLGPNLLYNGDFDNHIWYERFRGWSPTGWCQWFTRGGHAPEHAVGRHPSPPHPAHTGKEYVRIHMWGHAWRGGILQVVRDVQPSHYYRLTAYGFFQPKGAPAPKARVGIDPCGTLVEQFSVDVSKHPAPKYDEGVGDDSKTPAMDGRDIAESTVWSEYHDYFQWGRFEVMAEARSDTIMAILYCAPRQRPPDQPIYEMNWDSVALREIPWPHKRIVDENTVLTPDSRFRDVVLTTQPRFRMAQVTWGTKLPAGASQVVYRFLDSEAVNQELQVKEQTRDAIRISEFPFESPVFYERSAERHRVEIEPFSIPEEAVEVQLVALSRVCENGVCGTLCSSITKLRIQ